MSRRQGRPGSRSLIVDLYGAFLRDLGGWTAVADLITLMGDLGVDEQAVRSSVSRMSGKGLLVRSVRDGVVGYQLSPQAETIFEEGDERIFHGGQPADLAEGWILAVFSVPERDRSIRHQLRSRLSRLGCGRLDGGVWIAPHRSRDEVAAAVADLGLTDRVHLFEAHYEAFSNLADLARHCWNLDALNERYGAFARQVGPMLGQWRDGLRSGDRQAFMDYTPALHAWRKMPYLDPGLPPEMLPQDWIGHRAATLFQELVDQLQQPAKRYVKTVTSA